MLVSALLSNMEDSLAFAKSLDAKDPLRHFRQAFHIPERDGKPLLYFCGNSLGLQPRRCQQYIEAELLRWQRLAVEGHFEGKFRWFDYHKHLQPLLAPLLGAYPDEVVAMNNLTTNLHLMMVSFYQPEGKRYKILMEAGAFPSDQYAVETQLRFHGYDPCDALIEIGPRPGEYCLHTEDILACIEHHAEELALVLFGGVNYYTGQVFDMQAIAEAAHRVGARVGFDLAHAVGNVSLALHDWNVDFAVWCSYKYLNSGPGGVGGIFVHRRHHQSALPRFGGWWGHDEAERFFMRKGFKPIPTAEGWQLANEPILLMAAHRAALEIFHEAGMDRLIEKSRMLTHYLAFFIHRYCAGTIDIITPLEAGKHGCQLSLFVKHNGKALFDKLYAAGVVGDWREPNVIRLAPVPLYNSFEEVYHAGQLLRQCC